MTGWEWSALFDWLGEQQGKELAACAIGLLMDKRDG